MASIFTLKKNEGSIEEGKDGRPVYDPPSKQFLERQTEYENRLEEYNKQYNSALKSWTRSQEAEVDREAESAQSQSDVLEAEAEASKSRAEAAKQEAILESEKRKTTVLRGKGKNVASTSSTSSTSSTEAAPKEGLSPVVTTGAGAVGGWFLGASLGSVGGPLGAAVGAAIGWGLSKVMSAPEVEGG